MIKKNLSAQFIFRLAYGLWFLVLIITTGFVWLQDQNYKAKATESIKEEIVAPNVELKIITPAPAPTPIPTSNEPVFYLTDYERWLVESIVTGESGNQCYEGKVAVASCILNAAIKDDLTVAEVQNIYQYQGFYDINEWENLYPDSAKEVKRAVSQVFDKGEVISFDILWFYNPNNGSSSFHSCQKYIMTIEDHVFVGEWQ